VELASIKEALSIATSELHLLQGVCAAQEAALIDERSTIRKERADVNEKFAALQNDHRDLRSDRDQLRVRLEEALQESEEIKQTMRDDLAELEEVVASEIERKDIETERANAELVLCRSKLTALEDSSSAQLVHLKDACNVLAGVANFPALAQQLKHEKEQKPSAGPALSDSGIIALEELSFKELSCLLQSGGSDGGDGNQSLRSLRGIMLADDEDNIMAMNPRPTTGDHVRLAPDADSEARAKLALKGGIIGEIIQDDHDSQPYKVRAIGPTDAGTESWYRERDVVPWYFKHGISCDLSESPAKEEWPSHMIKRMVGGELFYIQSCGQCLRQCSAQGTLCLVCMSEDLSSISVLPFCETHDQRLVQVQNIDRLVLDSETSLSIHFGMHDSIKCLMSWNEEDTSNTTLRLEALSQDRQADWVRGLAELTGTTVVEGNQVEEEEVPDCIVCLEALDRDDPSSNQALACGHVFHRGCIMRWLQNHTQCPICRKPSGL